MYNQKKERNEKLSQIIIKPMPEHYSHSEYEAAHNYDSGLIGRGVGGPDLISAADTIATYYEL